MPNLHTCSWWRVCESERDRERMREGGRQRENSEQNCIALLLLLDNHLEVLVDDGNSKENPCATSNCSQEVCANGKGANASPSESCCCWDVAVQLLGNV